MLSNDQLKQYSKELKINESVVLREYIQTIFLKELYEENIGSKIFFKGGTAIRFVLAGSRFSEDLDFTVMGGEDEFLIGINDFFKKLTKLYGFNFKRRKTITGINFLLTAQVGIVSYKIFINLDFSFREKVLDPSKSVIKTIYPVVFTSFVSHLSDEEILAEKIRAIMTRNKGRDIYDLWFLLNKNVSINEKMVLEKLKYYKINKFDRNELLEKIKSFSKEKFVIDLRPFVPIGERDKLAGLFEYLLEFFGSSLS